MAAIPTPPAAIGVLTSPLMEKMNTPTLQADANMAVIGAVIAVVFVTLLSVVLLIIIYLYKNKGSYHTYEQPAADPEGSVQMEDLPYKGSYDNEDGFYFTLPRIPASVNEDTVLKEVHSEVVES